MKARGELARAGERWETISLAHYDYAGVCKIGVLRVWACPRVRRLRRRGLWVAGWRGGGGVLSGS